MHSAKKHRHILFLSVLLLICAGVVAQNNTVSPYSFTGIGELDFGYTAKNRGMGGVSSAVFSEHSYNFVNPASLGFVNRTVFDFGLRGERGTLQSGNNFRDFNNGNMNYIGLGFSVYNKKTRRIADTLYNIDHSIKKIKEPKNLINWSTGFSLTPFSSMGGDFQERLDTTFANALFINAAKGGLSNISLNNAIRFGEYISIGYQGSFAWGQTTRDRLLSFPDSQNVFSLQDQRFTQYNGFNHRLGLGIYVPFTSKINLSVGVTYRMPHVLKTDFTRTVRNLDYDFRGNLSYLDTLLFQKDIRSQVQVPRLLQVGGMFTIKEVIALGAEYTYQEWESVSMKEGWNEKFADYKRLSFSLTLRPESNPSKSMRKPELYFGYFITDLNALYTNNLNVEQSVRENGISFGIGLPVIKDVFNADGKREKYKSMIHLSGEYIRRGNASIGLVQEDIYRLTLGLSLSDLWFIQRKYR